MDLKNTLFPIAVIFVLACEPEIPISHENITSLTYVLTPQNGGVEAILNYYDPDGRGGIAAIIQTDTLTKNSLYTGSIRVQNGSIQPIKDVTYLIENHPERYQFFFTSDTNTVLVEYFDVDFFEQPIGLKTTLNTKHLNGDLKIVLRKSLDKGALWVNTGNITNAGGDTEMDIILPVKLK